MKNFLDSKDEKITEKAFSQGLVISVVSILLCLVALCSMTYAWFTGGTSSEENRITSGTFDLKVSVVKDEENGNATADATEIIKNETNVFCYTLPSDGSYTFTLTRVVGSNVNGYCYVTVGSGERQPTVTVENELTVTVTEVAGTVVTFEPWWGIHANSLIENGDTVPVETEQVTDAQE